MRRCKLVLLFLAVAAVLCMPCKASADAEVRLRYANFPPASTFPCVQMDHWIAEVHRLTGGRIHVDSFPAGALLDARAMLRGIIRGQAEIGCFSTAYYADAFPLTSVFELPLGFRSSENASEVLMKAILEFKPADLAKVKILTAFTCPPSQVMSRKPVTKLADIKGINLRAAGILAEEVSLLGGKPVSMPQSEAPDAIRRGAVDGIFSSLDVAKDLNYAETCRYGLLTDMSVYPFVVVMNRQAWDKLPDDLKKVLDDLAMPQALWTGRYVDAHAQEALEWGRKTYDIDYRPLSDAERAEALKAVSPLVDAWEKKATAAGLPAAEMLQFIRRNLK